jgi:hypothetical protein
MKTSFRKVSVSLAQIRQFSSSNSGIYKEFLTDVAKIEAPKNLDGLISILSKSGLELVDPRSSRASQNPFLVPLAKDSSDNSLIGYVRWPTQRDSLPLQVVKTNELGLSLLSLNTEHYCLKQAVEADINGNAKAEEFLQLANSEKPYSLGDAQKFLSTAKLPLMSEENKLRLSLDRFLLVKIGQFPDCYRRIALDYFKVGNSLSSLITCDRAINLFFGWGSPAAFHVHMLNQAKRPDESKDASKSALAQPLWTLGDKKEV